MATYLGSLVQLCCGEGGTLQASITGVRGESSRHLGHAGFAPAHSVCAFPVYTAQAPGCSAGKLSKARPALHPLPRSKPSGSGSQELHKGADSVGPAFCALPRLEQLRRPGAWQVHSPQVRWYSLSPPLSQLLRFLGVQQRAISGVTCLL